MTKHTPEPWFVHPDLPDTVTNREDGNGWEIALTLGDDHEQEAANARRAVACVNACEGISIEALEAMAKAKAAAKAASAKMITEADPCSTG